MLTQNDSKYFKLAVKVAKLCLTLCLKCFLRLKYQAGLYFFNFLETFLRLLKIKIIFIVCHGFWAIFKEIVWYRFPLSSKNIIMSDTLITKVDVFTFGWELMNSSFIMSSST